MLEYEDFDLTIGPLRKEKGDYHVAVQSPEGEDSHFFELTLDSAEVDRTILNLAEQVRGPPTKSVAKAATGMSLRDIGDQLFRALFSGPVRDLFIASLTTISKQPNKGLRIRLHIDPEDPDLAPLAGLPWEFMYHKETHAFLNLSQRTSIVRYLHVPRPPRPLSYEPPLRILVVISSPIDHKPLELEREKAQIEAAWGNKETVQVEFLEEATPEALRRKLSVGQFHVLHFMGHGDFDEKTGRGTLIFEDQRGYSRMISGESLSVLLRNAPTIRLVCLNACQTARAAEGKGLDPFSGVATALVMAGIPAVVAMQFEITDQAALTFAETFYPLLAQGQPVDVAVAEARMAIYLAEPDNLEWGTPVLFMRTPDGVLFKPPTEKLGLPSWLAVAAGCLILIVIAAVTFYSTPLAPLIKSIFISASTPAPTTQTTTPTDTPTPTTQVIIPTNTPTPTTQPPTPTSAPTLSPDINPTDGAEMVYVPAGEFTTSDQRTVYLDAFWIYKTEVTNTQYRAFIEAGGYEKPEYWTKEGWATRKREGWTEPRYWGYLEFNAPDQPVVGVNWYEAVAYCRWLSEETGEPYRLPTEAKWEKAACWDETKKERRQYPWGNNFDVDDKKLLNFCDSKCPSDKRNEKYDDDYPKTAPVGHYEDGASYYGALDMAGNVWEWTSSSKESGEMFARGGSWLDDQGRVHCDSRIPLKPEWHNDNLGFRCVWSDSP